MPVVGSIKVYRGEDITLNFTMVPPRDITGWVISLTVSKSFNNLNKIFQVTGIITSGPNGKYSMILPHEILDIDPATYAYDVFRNSPGQLRCLNVGDFIVGKDARFPQQFVP